MSSQRRTTRSSKANIPDIPLPPCREPPKKTEKEKNSNTKATVEKNLIGEHRTGTSSKETTSGSSFTEKPHPSAVVDIPKSKTTFSTSASNATASAAQSTFNDASPRLTITIPPNPPISVSGKPSASDKPSNLNVDLARPPRPCPRPRPVTAAQKAITDIDAMFISTHAGFRYKPQKPLQSVTQKADSQLDNAGESLDAEGGTGGRRAPKQRTFVNSMGMSIDFQDSSDHENDQARKRHPVAFRDATPGPDMDPLDEGNIGDDQEGQAVEDNEDIAQEDKDMDAGAQLNDSDFNSPEDEDGHGQGGQCSSRHMVDFEDNGNSNSQEDEDEHNAQRGSQCTVDIEPGSDFNSEEDEASGHIPIESDPSESDFSETTTNLKRKRANQARGTRNLTPTMSEQDKEDEEAFEAFAKTAPLSLGHKHLSKKGNGRTHEASSSPSPSRMSSTKRSKKGHQKVRNISPSPPRIPSSKKGKQRARDVSPRGVRDPELPEDDGVDIESTSGQHSSGPISNEDKEAAFAAHVEMMEKLENIAKRCNKPLKHFLAMVGLDARGTCALSAWDVYQPWYSAMVKKKPADVTIQVWNKVEVSVAYRKEAQALYDKLGTNKPSREETEEHFKEQFDFYHNMIKNYLTSKHKNKKFASILSKVVEPFIRMSTQVAAEFGIHIFGFAIETTPESCSSVAWGGSHEYKRLRDQHKTVIQTQLHDYEGMFKVAEMHGRANSTSKVKFFVDLQKRDSECERDYLRRILGEFLRSDLDRIFSERDKSSDESNYAGKSKMNWSWTDYAYNKELCIINWDKEADFPRYKKFDSKKISHKTLEKLVKPQIAWYQRQLEAVDNDEGTGSDNADNTDNTEEFSKLVQIVSWTEEQKTCPLKDKHSILLVTAVGGGILLKVFNCDHYVVSLKNIGASIPKYGSLEDSDSTTGQAAPTTRIASKKGSKQNRTRKKPQFIEVDSDIEESTP